MAAGIRSDGPSPPTGRPTLSLADVEAEESGGRDRARHGLSPSVLAYVVGPLALGVLLIFRQFGLVAPVTIWAYLGAIAGAAALSVLVEPWHSAPPGSVKLHARLAVHIVAVTVVIYMSGWGPALGMAYAFVALQELQTWGAFLWRPVLCWSLLNIAVAQVLVGLGVLPSMLKMSQAETVGALGAFVLAIVIRMAGATGEKKERAESLLAHQALHDMLTGLPNRALFYDRTDQVLARALVDGSATAVMLFDLDRFKEINDTMGHKYGDQVLTEVGPRVKSVLRAGDTLARLGGDEFCVLLPRRQRRGRRRPGGQSHHRRPRVPLRGGGDHPRDRGQLRDLDGADRRAPRRPPPATGRRGHVRGQGVPGPRGGLPGRARRQHARPPGPAR